MNKKIIIIVVAALVIAGGAYKTVLAKPKEKAPEPKVHGTVYVMPKEFLVNLADGRYAKLSVALVLEHLTPAADLHGQLDRDVVEALELGRRVRGTVAGTGDGGLEGDVVDGIAHGFLTGR